MQKFHDILVAKEYETRQNGYVEKKTAWNKVGKAWPSKSAESLSFELFLFPGVRYVIQLRENQPRPDVASEQPTE